jgi:hypothetical protein
MGVSWGLDDDSGGEMYGPDWSSVIFTRVKHHTDRERLKFCQRDDNAPQLRWNTGGTHHSGIHHSNAPLASANISLSDFILFRSISIPPLLSRQDTDIQTAHPLQ